MANSGLNHPINWDLATFDCKRVKKEFVKTSSAISERNCPQLVCWCVFWLILKVKCIHMLG